MVQRLIAAAEDCVDPTAEPVADGPLLGAARRGRSGRGTDDTGWGGFSGAPIVLPASMTVNAVGDIDASGASLLRFWQHLQEA